MSLDNFRSPTAATERHSTALTLLFKFLCYFSQRRSLLSWSPYFRPLSQRFSLILLPIRELRERFSFSAWSWDRCKRAAKRWKTSGPGYYFCSVQVKRVIWIDLSDEILRNVFRRIPQKWLKKWISQFDTSTSANIPPGIHPVNPWATTHEQQPG